jgi:hypothetical protein
MNKFKNPTLQNVITNIIILIRTATDINTEEKRYFTFQFSLITERKFIMLLIILLVAITKLAMISADCDIGDINVNNQSLSLPDRTKVSSFVTLPIAVVRGLRNELSLPAQTLRCGFESHWRHGCLCVFCASLFCVYIVSGETAGRTKKMLMRTYRWISLFKSSIQSAN